MPEIPLSESYKLYRWQDHAVRAGESTSDIVMCEVKGTLAGGQVTCKTPFRNNADISYVVLARTTTNGSGSFTADITEPGATDICTVLVIGKGYDLQGAWA